MHSMVTVMGIAGFLLVCGLSLMIGRPLAESLTGATVAALICGWIGRWWVRLLQSNLQEAKISRAQETVPEVKPEPPAPALPARNVRG